MTEQAIQTEDEGIAEITGIVRGMVREHRNVGVARALSAAAEALGIGLRRCRGYYHREIRALPEGELDDVRIAYTGHLRQRKEHLEDAYAEVAAYLRKHAAAA